MGSINSFSKYRLKILEKVCHVPMKPEQRTVPNYNNICDENMLCFDVGSCLKVKVQIVLHLCFFQMEKKYSSKWLSTGYQSTIYRNL